MAKFEALESRSFQPNWRGLLDNVLRKAAPDRVYHIELYQDKEIAEAIAERFDLTAELKADDPDFARKKHIAVQRFCGFDYVSVGLAGLDMPFHANRTDDTAVLARRDGREFKDEHTGPIANWEDFEKFPWPDPRSPEAIRNIARRWGSTVGLQYAEAFQTIRRVL